MIFKLQTLALAFLLVVGIHVLLPTSITYSQSEYGVLRSTDNGKSWQKVLNLRGVGPIDALIEKDRSIFAAAACYAGTPCGLFRSSDNGSSEVDRTKKKLLPEPD
jgi:hypothetical protein